MDTRPAYQLTERTVPTPRPAVDPVWRDELEAALELADEATRAKASPKPAPPAPERRFIGTGQPMTAPASEPETVAPASVRRTDGYVFASREELIAVDLF